MRITLSLLLAASAPRAQDLTLRSTTRFIAVDVTPSRHGAPVRGLKAEDFVITFQGCSVGKGDDGAKFLQILADSIGSASAWNEEVTVVDRDYFVVGRSASFVTKDKVPEPGTYALIVSGAFFLGLFKLRRRHWHFPGITQIR